MDPDTNDAARCVECEALLFGIGQQGTGLCDECWEALHPVSPDCAVGKHQACSGDAWDTRRDELTRCTCGCHGGSV